MQLADDLYVFPWTQPSINNCNSYFIGGGVPTLIDPGHSQLYGHVETAMAGDQLPEPVMVVLTHCHPDHMEAALQLQKKGAKVAMHPAEVAYMEGEGRQLAAALGMSFPELTVDVFLSDGELSLGEHALQVLHTPGHSPGHICLYWPANRALIAGDLVFAQGVGRVDFPGGDGQALKDSIQRVAKLDAQWVLPGHGPIIKGAENVQRNYQLIEQYYFGML